MMRINVKELRSNPREFWQYYLMTVSLPKKAKFKASLLDPQNFGKPLPYPKPIEPLIEAPLDKTHPDWVVKAKVVLPKEKQV